MKWNNSDHPRVPKGNLNGGQFENVDNMADIASRAAGTNAEQLEIDGRRKAHPLQVGRRVKISPGLFGENKIGEIMQEAPSGSYFGVQDEHGEFLGYFHESDLTIVEEEDWDEEDDW